MPVSGRKSVGGNAGGNRNSGVGKSRSTKSTAGASNNRKSAPPTPGTSNRQKGSPPARPQTTSDRLRSPYQAPSPARPYTSSANRSSGNTEGFGRKPASNPTTYEERAWNSIRDRYSADTPYGGRSLLYENYYRAENAKKVEKEKKAEEAKKTEMERRSRRSGPRRPRQSAV